MAKENTAVAEVVELTAEQKEITDLKSQIATLTTENTELKADVADLESTIVDLNEELSKAEKPSLETVQANLQKLGLNAVLHRGEVKSSTIGSFNGVPIHDLTDEQLDELEELEILKSIDN